MPLGRPHRAQLLFFSAAHLLGYHRAAASGRGRCSTRRRSSCAQCPVPWPGILGSHNCSIGVAGVRPMGALLAEARGRHDGSQLTACLPIGPPRTLFEGLSSCHRNRAGTVDSFCNGTYRGLFPVHACHAAGAAEGGTRPSSWSRPEHFTPTICCQIAHRPGYSPSGARPSLHQMFPKQKTTESITDNPQSVGAAHLR